jgi:hypothetical protein
LISRAARRFHGLALSSQIRCSEFATAWISPSSFSWSALCFSLRTVSPKQQRFLLLVSSVLGNTSCSRQQSFSLRSLPRICVVAELFLLLLFVRSSLLICFGLTPRIHTRSRFPLWFSFLCKDRVPPVSVLQPFHAQLLTSWPTADLASVTDSCRRLDFSAHVSSS